MELESDGTKMVVVSGRAGQVQSVQAACHDLTVNEARKIRYRGGKLQVPSARTREKV